jgi:hypothetical protein
VTDGPGGNLFDGEGGATLSTPTTVVVSLILVDTTSGSDVTMTASSATGIVSVEGSLAWAGATGLVLPYP